MKRVFIRIKCGIEKQIYRVTRLDAESVKLHIGSNSVALIIILTICAIIAFNVDVLKWNYLRGLEYQLAFVIGLATVLLGLAFYRFWNLDEQSIYTFHLISPKYIPNGTHTIFVYQNIAFGVNGNFDQESAELPNWAKLSISCLIFFLLLLITLDNRGMKKIEELPSAETGSSALYCPEKEDEEEEEPMEGCALLIKAFKLGYAKDLGDCEPKKKANADMEICLKRRKGEPYLHYSFRKITDSLVSLYQFFRQGELAKIKQRFELQTQNLESLRDYTRYAISASPRASHHIWTNLPYPENEAYRKMVETFNPNFCIEKFQNQTNTIRVKGGDERRNAKILEHVYGHLLFNPKVKMTVGFCKEFKIHWNAEPDTCQKMAKSPLDVFNEYDILDEVNLVLERHDVSSEIIRLGDQLKEIEQPPEDEAEEQDADNETQKKKSKITKDKIAKSEEQLRPKNQLVSFQCFMQIDTSKAEQKLDQFTYEGSEFTATTRNFPIYNSNSETQIAIYKEFAKTMAPSFNYTAYNSRSDLDVGGGEAEQGGIDENYLRDPTYLLTRLETLRNIDIFLGKNWILDRDDLLEVYPFHVHLQNYVQSFRMNYDAEHGRL